MENESTPEVYEIIAWDEGKGRAYCLNCWDLDKRYQPLYKNDFLPGEIIKCLRCGEVIRGGTIAGLRDGEFVLCLDCNNLFTDEPLAEQDLSPGEKVVCHYCGKTIMG